MANVHTRHVEELLQLGMVVLATDPRDKNPGVLGKGWQHKTQADVQLAWWNDGDRGAFVRTGEVSGWVVLDLDNQAAVELWKGRIDEDLWDQLPVSVTGKGRHLWFRVSGPWQSFTWQADPEAVAKDAHYDLQADGKGVMVPPSLYPGGGGRRYRWSKKPYDGAPSAPELLQRASVASREPGGAPRDSQQGRGRAVVVRSLASELLLSPPSEGGRNEWLAKVLGHFAKAIKFEDMFYATAVALNRSLASPLDDAEVTKTAESIWRSEDVNHGDMPTVERGWLTSQDGRLHVFKKGDKQKGTADQLVPAGNFDLEVLGRYTDEHHQTFYRLAMHSTLRDEVRYALEEARVFGTDRTLAPWLAAREMNLYSVPGHEGGSQSGGVAASRIATYLATADAPSLQVSPAMGWYEAAGGFVAQEGLITAEGLDPQGGWLPDPVILKRDKHVNRYGFEGSEQVAMDLLREVMTWQYPEVTSVFGAWWAACLLKGQLMAKVAGFPFMAIEAMSGSGKTNGYFGTMIALSGSTRDEGGFTQATFRDALASNRSGTVWIDDPQDPESYYPFIRLATSESSWSKKGDDSVNTMSMDLVAPVLLTAESLPRISDERALQDRLITIDVPSAKDRPSNHGRASQWDDIIAIRAAHPRMWEYAGWYVQAAMRHATLIGGWDQLRAGSGRHADKMAVLKLGARVMAEMIDVPWCVDIVDEWTTKQSEPDSDYLANRILPELLRSAGILGNGAAGWQPVFVLDDIVWWHPGKVAEAWAAKYRHGDPRTRAFGEPTALARHRQAMGISKDDRRLFDVHLKGEPRSRKPYYACPPDVSARIIDKADT
jgi:hypothetical protein